LLHECVLASKSGGGAVQCSAAPRLTMTRPPPPSPPICSLGGGETWCLGAVRYGPQPISRGTAHPSPKPGPAGAMAGVFITDGGDDGCKAVFSSSPDSRETITTGNGARIPSSPQAEDAIGN
ncbi:unnamed protein product, partial [Ectocarpus sp. 12 AP-2014]